MRRASWVQSSALSAARPANRPQSPRPSPLRRTYFYFYFYFSALSLINELLLVASHGVSARGLLLSEVAPVVRTDRLAVGLPHLPFALLPRRRPPRLRLTASALPQLGAPYHKTVTAETATETSREGTSKRVTTASKCCLPVHCPPIDATERGDHTGRCNVDRRRLTAAAHPAGGAAHP
jgi:hypothetical protein